MNVPGGEHPDDGVAGLPIVLMGLRGSGKSTLGRLLGEELGREFVDLDERTPRVLGHESLREAWDQRGEEAFREAEVEALRDVLSQGVVLALGGGTPTAPGAPAMLREARARGAILVYLRGSPEALGARLLREENRDRPSLTGAGVVEEIAVVFAARDPLYRELATIAVDTDGRSIGELLELLLGVVEP